MSKENKVVEIEETVETTELVEAEAEIEVEDSKVKQFWNKAKKPLSYIGIGILGLIGGVALASRGSVDDFEDFEDEDFDVDVESTEE